MAEQTQSGVALDSDPFGRTIGQETTATTPELCAASTELCDTQTELCAATTEPLSAYSNEGGTTGTAAVTEAVTVCLSGHRDMIGMPLRPVMAGIQSTPDRITIALVSTKGGRLRRKFVYTASDVRA